MSPSEAKAEIMRIAASADIIVCGLLIPEDVIEIAKPYRAVSLDDATKIIRDNREELAERFNLESTFALEDIIFEEENRQGMTWPQRDDDGDDAEIVIEGLDWDNWEEETDDDE